MHSEIKTYDVTYCFCLTAKKVYYIYQRFWNVGFYFCQHFYKPCYKLVQHCFKTQIEFLTNKC